MGKLSVPSPQLIVSADCSVEARSTFGRIGVAWVQRDARLSRLESNSKSRISGRRPMSVRKGTGIPPAAGSAPAAAARDDRPARIPHAQPGCRPRPRRRRRRGEERHRLGLRAGPAADADLLSVDRGPASRHPDGERQVPGHQLPDRAGRGLRHRALRRRGQEQGKHLGRLCRPDAVRRNVGDDRGRRDRAVGQLHPEGRARRHHPVDPRGEHDRRQALWLAVPARRDRHGLALGPDDQGRPARRGARDLGRLPGQRQDDRRFQAPRRSARPSTPMAGARWRRSPTA